MATFVTYNSDDIVLSTDKVISSTWSDNINTLTSSNFNTSSAQASFSSPTSSGYYYISNYQFPTSSTLSEVQFTISYGNIYGSGSPSITNDVGSYIQSPSYTIYNQYRNLVYGDENTYFQFEGTTPDDIFIININRARYKERLRTGFNLKLSGSGGLINLTDDSLTTSGSVTISNIGRQYRIVSGSSGVRSGSVDAQTPSGSYGFFYPDAGLFILNAAAVSHSIGLPIDRTEPDLFAVGNASGNQTLFNALNLGSSFTLDSVENLTSRYFFTRVKNNEFNYSTNPSFITDDGTLRFTSMYDNPKVYITTIGLYNTNNELLAVAKLSQPISKDFTEEALFRIKLDF